MLFCADRIGLHVDIGVLQPRHHLVGDALRVRALVVDHEDLLRLERVDHEVRILRALEAVRRDHAVEGRVRPVGQPHARRGRRHHREAGLPEDRAARVDGRIGLGADDGHDALVGDELLRDRRALGRIQLVVALDDLDVGPVLLVELVDCELCPVQLLAALRPCGPGEHRHHPDGGLAGGAARSRAAVAVVAAAPGGDHDGRADDGEECCPRPRAAANARATPDHLIPPCRSQRCPRRVHHTRKDDAVYASRSDGRA